MRNDNERIIYEALLDLARHGKLEPVHEYSRPSVAFQQILSHAWQGLRKEKPLTLKNLAVKTGGHDFSEVVNDMLTEGHLKLNQGALIPSDPLIDLGDRSVIHTVIAGDGAKPVYDGVTGELVAAIGAGAGDGLYFLGGTLRRIASAERNSYVLEQVEPKGPRHIGKIPAARGGRGISRTLVWKIAEMTGHNPRNWSWSSVRLVTWGGWANNLLLKYLLDQHGYGTASSFDAFALEGIKEREEINPEIISELVRNFSIHFSLREAEKFREPSRFYRYLSTTLRTKEAESSVPITEFTQWLNDCIMDPERSDEIEPEKSALAEEFIKTPHEQNKEAIEESETKVKPQIGTTKLKLQLHWKHDGENAALTFAEAIVSLFFNESGGVVIKQDRGVTFADLDLRECIHFIRTGKQVQILFFKNSQDNDAIELLSVFVDTTEDETPSPTCVIQITASESFSLLTPPRNLSWYQADFNYLSPMPLLALPRENNACLHPTALHGMVVLASKLGHLETAILLKENEPGEKDAIARWHTLCPNDDREYHPIIPLAGDCLWLPTINEAQGHQAAALWVELIDPEPIPEYPDLREKLSSCFLDDSPNIEKINDILAEALPVSTKVVPLAEHTYPTLMTAVQKETVLVLSPDNSAVTLGVDLHQPPALMLDSLLHGVGHVLLGHVRPIDEYGHTDTVDCVSGEGTLRRWDREVRESFSDWFTSEKPRKAESIADCTPNEKATLGLWRMIGEMLGESRRLHCRAEEYQHAAYQRQAAQRLLAQLEEYGGAMLCDGVGLGKTYVATTLMVHYANAWRDRHQDNPDALLSDPFRVTILAPNSVVSTWKREALPPLAAHGVSLTTVRVISHTKLSRISKASEALEPPSRKELSDLEHLLLSDLVVVDEAHNFRSVSARRTVVLRDLLRLQPRRDQRRRVLILTATPVNNSLDDLIQETALLFSKPLWMSDAATEEGYRRQAIKEINTRCAKARSSKGPKGDVSPLLIHGEMDERFSIANDFRDDLDFGPNVQRIGDYLKEQDLQLKQLQQDIREAAETGRARSSSEPKRIAEELLDRIVVQRSRDLCKEIERQQGSDVDLLFRADAGLPEKLRYSDEYDGIHDVLAGFLPLFERGDQSGLQEAKPLSLKVYMWYDIREGIKSWDDVSSVVGLQRMLILKRLESSPVSFLITLLRLTILHAFRIQQLASLCARMKDVQRKNVIDKEISRIIAKSDEVDLDKIGTLATGGAIENLRNEFLQRLSKAYTQKVPTAETDDIPMQLSLFEPEDSEQAELKDQLDRLWGLKDDLLQDFATLLSVIPGLADVIFGKFKRDEWPKRFTLGGDAVDWPTSTDWGLRIVTDAKIRALAARLIEARRHGQKVIVFSQFTDTLAYVHSVLHATSSFEQADWRIVLPALNIAGLKAKEISDLIEDTGVITGDTEDRDGMVNAFAPFYRIGPLPPPTDDT
ncbi:MAG: SNF2-related protein, partial [Deltaproteobacteria bacterium]